MLHRLSVFSVSVLAVLAAACGGGGGGGSQANNASGLESAAREFASALYGGDAKTAYTFFTEECRALVSEEELEQTLEEFEQVLEFFEADLDDIEVDEVRTRNVADGRGEALVTFSGPDEFEDAFNDEDQWGEFVYEDGGWRIDDCAGFEPPDDGDDGDGATDDDDDDGGFGGSGGDDDEPALSGPGSSRDEPAPPGTTIALGGWEVTITGANLDAADELIAQDEFIEEPEAGDVYVLITLEATYLGDGEDESTSFFFDFNYGAVGDSAVAYDSFEDACTFFDLPDGLDTSREVFEGGTISGDLCLSIAEEEVDSVLFYLETFDFTKTRAWFELQ